ncbi:hypothetical protein TNCV_769341 [Trichonephila clavipes]|nr:hypothetical protein TNCV_769341 [Trichonephila clavipes]
MLNNSHLNCHHPYRSMERLTNTELADMHLIHVLAEGKARTAERLYRGRYSEGGHGIQDILFHALDKMYWIPFEGIRVPCWEVESLTARSHYACNLVMIHIHTNWDKN